MELSMNAKLEFRHMTCCSEIYTKGSGFHQEAQDGSLNYHSNYATTDGRLSITLVKDPSVPTHHILRCC